MRLSYEVKWIGLCCVNGGVGEKWCGWGSFAVDHYYEVFTYINYWFGVV